MDFETLILRNLSTIFIKYSSHGFIGYKRGRVMENKLKRKKNIKRHNKKTVVIIR